MATRTSIELVDDLDGGTAEETVSFGLDGQPYEIDLSAEHAHQLRAVLREWAGHARHLAGASARRPRASRRVPVAVRQWASDNGYEVSERGRISTSVREAYRAATGQ